MKPFDTVQVAMEWIAKQHGAVEVFVHSSSHVLGGIPAKLLDWYSSVEPPTPWMLKSIVTSYSGFPEWRFW